MATEYTFTTLKSAVKEWLEDDAAEFEAALTNIVDLAELQLIKDLDFTIFDLVATGTLTSATLTKPATWLGTIELLITDENGDKVPLEPKPWGYVQMYSGSGTPAVYTELSDGSIAVAPTPSSTPYALRYISRPTPLSETTSTWLSENVADCLFWQTIVKSEHFRKADDRIEAAKGFYADAIATAKAELSHLVRRRYK